MQSRLDRVRVATRDGDTEISWECREKLLDVIRKLDSDRHVVRAFEAVGATRPVELDRDGKVLLVRALHVIANNAGGLHKLPRSLGELRQRLVAELELANSG